MDLGDWFTDDSDASEARNLGRSAFVDVVERGIDACKKRRSSTVLSLVGSWGSGKSSIIDAVVDDLQPADGGWKVVRFNPWTFQDLPSLQSGFFAELRDAFPQDAKGKAARAKISGLAEAVAPLASVATLVGVDGTAVVERVAKLVGGDQSVTAAQQQLEKILHKRAVPLLVIMDDLDRLAPDELLLTLKLVRLIGRLPHVHYLLAYDEDTLLDTLSRTGLVGESKSRARDYLEKVVQVRFDVPALRPDDITAMIDKALDRTLVDVGITMTDAESQRFARAYFSHLQRRLDTPRAIRRYWAQVRLSIEDLAGELDVADFLILTWLRTAEPGAYRLVQERRGDILGTSRRAPDFSPRDIQAAQTDLHSALDESGTRPSHVAGVSELLGQIFPNFRAAWEAKPRVHPVLDGQRVSNSNYFDRYFSLGVTQGDIRDSTVREAITQIASGSPGPAVGLLTATLLTLPQLALAKVASASENADPAPVFVWLADHYYDVDFSSSRLSPREQSVDLGTTLLRRIGPSELLETISSALRTNSGIPFTIKAIAAASRKSDEDLPGTALVLLDDLQRTALGELFEDAYQALNVTEPLTMEPDLWNSTWAWASIDRPSYKRWIADRQAEWGGLDLLARFVSVLRPSGGAGEGKLNEIDFEFLADVIDLEALEFELESQLEGAETPDADRPRPATPENRRIIALGYLAARRRGREARASLEAMGYDIH